MDEHETLPAARIDTDWNGRAGEPRLGEGRENPVDRRRVHVGGTQNVVSHTHDLAGVGDATMQNLLIFHDGILPLRARAFLGFTPPSMPDNEPTTTAGYGTPRGAVRRRTADDVGCRSALAVLSAVLN